MSTEKNGTEKNRFIVEVIKLVLYIGGLIVAIMLFTNNINSRITVIETEMVHKVGDKDLFDKLEKMEQRINTKIETEISKLKLK